MSKYVEMAKNSPTFCIMPFTHMATKTNGEMKLCCRSWPLYSIKDKSMLEVWNSDKYRRVREQLLLGEKPKECHACWYTEDHDVRSMRQRQNIMKCERDNYLETLNDLCSDYSLPNKIRSIELKLSNICNLKCRMCHPVDSTEWAKDWDVISHLQKDNEWTYNNVRDNNLVKSPYLCEWKNHPSFFEELKMISDSLETLWFAGGETLIDPLHYKILESVKDKAAGIRLQYSTNLTEIRYKGKLITDYWKNFRRILCGVSLDGIHEVYNYIRTNANFDEVMENVRIVREDAIAKNVNIGMVSAYTVQACNIFNVPETFDFFMDNNLWLHTHRVSYPKFLSCQVIPQELKKILTKKMDVYIEVLEHREIPIDKKRNVIKNVKDVRNFMNGDDLNNLWPQFIEFNRLIEKKVGSKPIEEVIPELRGYV